MMLSTVSIDAGVGLASAAALVGGQPGHWRRGPGGRGSAYGAWFALSAASLGGRAVIRGYRRVALPESGTARSQISRNQAASISVKISAGFSSRRLEQSIWSTCNGLGARGVPPGRWRSRPSRRSVCRCSRNSRRPCAAPQGAPQAAPAGQVLQLSMEQAATMAIEYNLGVKAERLNLDVASQDVAVSKASFLPIVSFGINRNNRQQPPQAFADGTASIASSNNISGNGSVQQNLRWFGGQYQVRWDANRLETLGGGSTFNPSLGSTLNIAFSQPLWRDREIDPLRGGLEASERRRVGRRYRARAAADRHRRVRASALSESGRLDRGPEGRAREPGDSPGIAQPGARARRGRRLGADRSHPGRSGSRQQPRAGHRRRSRRFRPPKTTFAR